MPDNMRNEIRAVADTVSAKELMEAGLSAVIRQRSVILIPTELYIEEDASADTLISMTETIALLQPSNEVVVPLSKQETEQAYDAATAIPLFAPLMAESECPLYHT